MLHSFSWIGLSYFRISIIIIIKLPQNWLGFFLLFELLNEWICGKINQILFDIKSNFLKTFSYIARTMWNVIKKITLFSRKYLKIFSFVNLEVPEEVQASPQECPIELKVQPKQRLNKVLYVC